MSRKTNIIRINPAVKNKNPDAWYVLRKTYGLKGYGTYIDVFLTKRLAISFANSLKFDNLEYDEIYIDWIWDRKKDLHKEISKDGYITEHY